MRFDSAISGMAAAVGIKPMLGSCVAGMPTSTSLRLVPNEPVRTSTTKSDSSGLSMMMQPLANMCWRSVLTT